MGDPDNSTPPSTSPNIRILIAGGTFDKQYDEISQQLVFKTTNIPSLLTLARSTLDITVQELFLVDSLDMTEEQRQVIVDTCVNAPEKHIVITHGTDTMAKTGQSILQHVQDKVIVLTGAMVPYAFGSSDGFFNLGAALAFVQTLAPGVYVAMNGKVLPVDHVKKNLKTGVFEAI